MASITCGNCHQTHGSVQEVKDCYTLGKPATTEAIQATQAQPVQPATMKQTEYAKALAAERPNWHDAFKDGNLYERCFDLTCDGSKFVSKEEASAVIAALKALPKEDHRPSLYDVLEDGVYVKDPGTKAEVLYKIVHAVHGSGHQYAKRLSIHKEGDKVTGEWIYEGKRPLSFLTQADRLTAERAKAFGLLYGMCIRCTKDLTREESIHVGYGRTCAGHEGWWYPTKAELKALQAQPSPAPPS